MPIKIKLSKILMERNMSQRELARLTGLRPNTINDLCNQRAIGIHFETLEKICKVLNIRVEDLVEVE